MNSRSAIFNLFVFLCHARIALIIKNNNQRFALFQRNPIVNQTSVVLFIISTSFCENVDNLLHTCSSTNDHKEDHEPWAGVELIIKIVTDKIS